VDVDVIYIDELFSQAARAMRLFVKKAMRPTSSTEGGDNGDDADSDIELDMFDGMAVQEAAIAHDTLEESLEALNHKDLVASAMQHLPNILASTHSTVADGPSTVSP